jgi:hypothetical protein
LVAAVAVHSGNLMTHPSLSALSRSALRRWTLLSLFGAAALGSTPAGAQFVPTEVLASSTRGLIDPEFNQAKGQFTWVDLQGSIWIGGIDKSTGELTPLSGKAQLIERQAAPKGGLGFTLNGPEWVYGADADRIVYTRFPPDLPETPENARIGVAWQNPDASWTRRTLSPDVALNGPYGSESTDDRAPHISYNDAFGNRYWREIDNPDTEEALPGLPQAQFPVARFARGQRAAVYPVKVGATDQVFRYELDTQVFEQLTFGPGQKEQPWMWPAPEFGNEQVLMVTVGKNRLALLRKGLDPTQPQAWTAWHVIQAPLDGRFFSTEPFVYNGKSYVVMMIIVGEYPTSIWVANFDRDAPLLRRVTPESPDRARADPEVFITDRGPVIFFGRYNQNLGRNWLCSRCAEGLYRAETGIGPD